MLWRPAMRPALRIICLLAGSLSASAQEPGSDTAPPASAAPPAAREVEVAPLAQDEEIRIRLQRILDATGWFEEAEVRVDEGVVFLTGTADSPDHRLWATELTMRTEAVVAAVNQMNLASAPAWDFQPVRDGLDQLRRDGMKLLPFIAMSGLILALSILTTRLVMWSSRRLLVRRIDVALLREVFVYLIGMSVLMLGIYIVLRVSGLTRLALTVLGGTGLFGLVVGIAFRDITENFLASVFLSVQRPFRSGDFVEIAGFLGTVQAVTVRSTVLLTFDGIHVQIPNAAVYKSTLRNFTSHPVRREEVAFPVPHEAPLEELQNAMLSQLRDNPSILTEPEPWVFVDQVSTSGIQLRLYYWYDTSRENGLRIRSSLLRHAQRQLERLHLGFAVEVRRWQRVGPADDEARSTRQHALYTHAEGRGESQAVKLAQQAAEVASPEPGTNLLAERDGQSP